MTTLRIAKRDRYTSVSRLTINDERLSFRARGVLVWLLDKPDDWRFDSESISGAGSEGRDAVRRALQELESCGYLLREKFRDGGGRFVTIVTVYERPGMPEMSGDVPSGIPVLDVTCGDGAKVQVAPATDYPASENQAPLRRLRTEQRVREASEEKPQPIRQPLGPENLRDPDCPQCGGSGETETKTVCECFQTASTTRRNP